MLTGVQQKKKQASKPDTHATHTDTGEPFCSASALPSL